MSTVFAVSVSCRNPYRLQIKEVEQDSLPDEGMCLQTV